VNVNSALKNPEDSVSSPPPATPTAAVKADGSQQDAREVPGSSDAEDRALVGRFVKGDRAAFAELVRRHQARITRLAFRLLGWRGEVEDVVQEVFVAALQSLHRFRGQSSLATWLMALTINECRRQRRKRMLRWMFGLRRKVEPASMNAAADESAIGAERSAQVQRAVRGLPLRYREVIVLRYLEEMNIDQIAGMLRLSRNAVEVRLHRSREQLRQALGDLWED
jgi:RNA polymerase sigma-70 factor, ECF subfamily